MNSPKRNRISFRKVFAIPSSIALISLIGLVSALLDDGIYDAISWIALFIPIAIIFWALKFRGAD